MTTKAIAEPEKLRKKSNPTKVLPHHHKKFNPTPKKYKKEI